MITNEEAVQILACMALEKKISPDDRIKEDIEALEMGIAALKNNSVIESIIDRLERSIRKTAVDSPEFSKGVRHALAIVKQIAGCEDE